MRKVCLYCCQIYCLTVSFFKGDNVDDKLEAILYNKLEDSQISFIQENQLVKKGLL